MYLNQQYIDNSSGSDGGLTLTWDVFKQYWVSYKSIGSYTININMRCI